MTAHNPAEQRRADAKASAESRRQDYLRALREELDGYERTPGKEDRAKAVKAEISRVEKLAPKGEAVSDDPALTAAEKQQLADSEREAQEAAAREAEAEKRTAEEAAAAREAAAPDDAKGKRAAATSRPRGRGAASTSTTKG